jgi:hypothetical protein
MRPEGAPEHVFGRVHGPASIQDLKAIDGDLERLESELPVGRPFKAILLLGLNPGLKPWAILSSHFVATAASPHQENRPRDGPVR